MKEQLQCIAKKENVNLSPEAADRIVDFSEGDLRHAINALQTASVYKDRNALMRKQFQLSSAKPAQCKFK